MRNVLSRFLASACASPAPTAAATLFPSLLTGVTPATAQAFVTSWVVQLAPPPRALTIVGRHARGWPRVPATESGMVTAMRGQRGAGSGPVRACVMRPPTARDNRGWVMTPGRWC